MIIPIAWPQGPIFTLHAYQICHDRCFDFMKLIIISRFARIGTINSTFYTPRNEVRGGGGVYWIHPVCLSVCPSVRPLTFRVRPVASTVRDGFFPCLVQMITSMRGCVACDDIWPWPISSRSFGLDLENRVRSVESTVLDGFFLYLAQIITIIRGCVACYVFFRIWKFKFLANLNKISALTLKKKSTVLDGFFPNLAQMITSMRLCCL